MFAAIISHLLFTFLIMSTWHFKCVKKVVLDANHQRAFSSLRITTVPQENCYYPAFLFVLSPMKGIVRPKMRIL